MNNFRKSRLSVALAAAMGTLAVSPQVGAVNLATDGIGEVAIAPYFTIRNGWETLFNLTNTRNVPIVVKVRFHEGQNSRDILDFNVALSSRDVFAFYLSEGANGPRLNIVDTDTCTIPQLGNGVDFASSGVLAFTGDSDDKAGLPTPPTSADNIDRLREGYVEFIVMGYGQADGDGVYEYPRTGDPAGGNVIDVPEAIEDHQCDLVSQAFVTSRIHETAAQFGEPINSLAFNYNLINLERGVGAAGQSTTWANFWNLDSTAVAPDLPADGMTGPLTTAKAIAALPYEAKVPGQPNVAYPDPGCLVQRGDNRELHAPGPNPWVPGGAGSCPNLVTAQQYKQFLEPTLNDAFPPVGAWWDDSANTDYERQPSNSTWDSQFPARGVDALSLTIQRYSVIGEWATNVTGAGLGAVTDWWLTFPTKLFYVDPNTHVQAAMPPYNDGTVGEADGGREEALLDRMMIPYEPFERPWEPVDANDDPVDILVDPTLSTAVDYKACEPITIAYWDRSENSPNPNTPDDQPIISPAPPPPPAEVDTLCWETNILTFRGNSVFGSKLARDIDTSGVPGNVGWMSLGLYQVDSSNNPLAGSPAVEGIPSTPYGGTPDNLRFSGLPVIGGMMKQRTYNDPVLNHAYVVDHRYVRGDVTSAP